MMSSLGLIRMQDSLLSVPKRAAEEGRTNCAEDVGEHQRATNSLGGVHAGCGASLFELLFRQQPVL